MRLKVLGPVEAERDGVPLSVGGPRQRRLLALLVVNRGRPVTTDRLVDALWPDGDAPDGAARSMRTYMSRLRVVLPDGSITARGSGYVLDSGAITVDVDDFDALLDEAERAVPDVALERYDRALQIWRGPPFGEFTDEWWAIGESSRLIERRVSSEERRAMTLMSIGHHDRAIPDLERLVAEHPLRERPVRLLMQSLHVTGRRAEALRVHEAFRTRLVEETGLDPSPELFRLAGSILADDELAGQLPERPLRGYTIHRAIGEGAHGRVYEATQPGTARRVAIKVIRPDLADSSEFIRRFEAEARLVARLEHPHIVPLYDFWREPGGAYLVLRLLTGGTARDATVSGGPWSLDRVSRLLEEIGGALIYAHATGVTHNDVKASNVLLDAGGAAFLTDFGIAVAGDDASVTEQAERGDVRSLAWMLSELLTGSPRSPGPSRTSTARSRLGPPPSLIGRVAALPDGLAALLAGAGSHGGVGSIAELVLGWRAATGFASGALTPLTSSDRRVADSSRRRAAHQLALAATAGVNPYRGLRPFDEADAEGFHGREEVVDDLLDALESRSFVAVVGASGSGKSSVVRAGLLPRLRGRGTAVVTMVPSEDPLGALREALTEVATISDADEGGVPVGALAAVASRFGRVVVVVDQFEECWTRADGERREAFLDVMAEALADQSTDVRFVATVRADLLDRPLEHPRLGTAVGEGAYVLPPLAPAGLGQAIAMPAEHAGVQFEDGVVADLIADAATQPGSLPLVQFALSELYDRRVDGVIDRSALVAIGGIAGAIGRRAEQLYCSLDEAERVDARLLFGRLVVPGRDAPDTRRRALVGELTPGMRAVGDRYVEARLLVTDRDPATREPTLELAHEALLARWSRLAGWIDEDRRWLAQLQHLSAGARAWDAGGRRDSELLRGVRLEAAIEAIDGEGRVVSPLERAYVDSGRQVRDADVVTARRTARRLRRRLTAAVVALVLVLVAGSVALVQRRAAIEAADEADAARLTALEAADDALAAERAALIEALVGRAESLRATQRDTAALLAVEAYRLADTPRTRSTLFGLFTDDERFLDAHRFTGDRGTSGIVMPDGASAYLTGQDGHVRPYDLETGALGEALPAVGVGDTFPILAASPDGSLLAIASRSDPAAGPTTFVAVATATGAFAIPPIEIDGPVTSIAYLPGGRVALSIGESGDVVVVDVTSGEEVTTLAGLDIPEDEIIWTLDPASAGGRVMRRPSSVAVVAGELLVGTPDGSLRVFDADTLEPRRALELAPQTLSTMLPLADGTVVTSGRFGFARLELASGTTRWENSEFERCVNLMVMESRGVLYCGDPYGRLEERDLDTGAVLRRLDAHNGDSGALWAADHGTELVSFGDNEPVVSRWRLDRSGPITRVVAPGWAPVEFDETGELLLVERGDPLGGTYEAAILDAADGTMVTRLDGLFVPSWSGAGALLGVGLTSTGAIEFARAAVDEAGRAGDLRFDGAIVQRVDRIEDIRIDAGKDRMLIRYREGTDNSLTTLDTESLRYGPTVDVDGLVSWTTSRRGDRIVAGTSGGVVVFDADTGEPLDGLSNPDLRAVIVTPADQLFVGSLGGELTQYDLETLEAIRTLGGSRGHVFGGAGTADGSMLAINGGDRVATIFDVATGVQIGGPITIAHDEHNAVRLSLDGRWLAVGGEATVGDGIEPGEAVGSSGIQIWDLDPTSWIRGACGVAGRNLTPEEWATHIGPLAPYRLTCPHLASI